MSTINMFAQSTVKFFACLGNLFAGDDASAPAVSNSAYLGHSDHRSLKASSYKSDFFGKLAA